MSSQFLKEHREEQESVLVLDEITTGLHPKDVEQLIQFLRRLSERGATAIAIDITQGSSLRPITTSISAQARRLQEAQ